MRKYVKSLVNAAVIGVIATSPAHSGGFSLYMEDNGSAVGNFAAGIAAEGADASIGWYNPAGLVLIRNRQVVLGGVGVFPVSKLTGTSTFNTNSTLLHRVISYAQNFHGIETSENALVPSGHFAMPLGENATFGISLVSPFGLATDWGEHSPIRYQATFTELLTTNLSPEIGGRITQNFSIGAGLDLQYARVKFNRIIGTPTVLDLFHVDPSLNDTLSYNKGTSYGIGFHAGVLGMFNENHTRIGLNYQSTMRHQFRGYSAFNGNLANNPIIAPLKGPGVFYSDDLYSNYVKLPDLVTLSGYQDVNEKLALLGSVVYTGWSVFKEIQLNNVAAASVAETGVVTPVIVNSISPQNYRDAWRFALGANYRVNQALMLRVGGGYDQTPTNDVDRDARLPDSSRWGLSVGTHYQLKPTLGIDLGYTHLFGEDSYINRTDPLGLTSSYNVRATGENYANLFSAQVVWGFDEVEAVGPMKP